MTSLISSATESLSMKMLMIHNDYTAVKEQLLGDGQLSAEKVDPGVDFDYSAPWLGSFRSIAGMIGATVVVCLFIGGVISVGFLIFGKLSKSEQGTSKGLTGLLYTVIAAAILGSLAGIIGWASGLPLIPA